jgi:4-nitrophenyl phosphatase
LQKQLSSIRAMIIDMDGVLYCGDEPTPGVVEFFEFLRQRQIRYRLVTNNSSRLPEEYRDKLRPMGVDVDPSLVLTSGAATALYLREHARKGARIYVIGEKALHCAVFDSGGRDYVWDEVTPEYVVLGIDFDLTYQKLKTAALAIRRGAEFVASNVDATLPTEEGELPGSGALVAALEVATSRRPIIIGKPEPLMLDLALSDMKAKREETAIIGDRIATDIVGAQRVGLATILVMTGVTTKTILDESTVKPDFVFDDLPALVRAWEKG